MTIQDAYKADNFFLIFVFPLLFLSSFFSLVFLDMFFGFNPLLYFFKQDMTPDQVLWFGYCIMDVYTEH